MACNTDSTVWLLSLRHEEKVMAHLQNSCWSTLGCLADSHALLHHIQFNCTSQLNDTSLIYLWSYVRTLYFMSRNVTRTSIDCLTWLKLTWRELNCIGPTQPKSVVLLMCFLRIEKIPWSWFTYRTFRPIVGASFFFRIEQPFYEMNEIKSEVRNFI